MLGNGNPKSVELLPVQVQKLVGAENIDRVGKAVISLGPGLMLAMSHTGGIHIQIKAFHLHHS